MQTINLNRAWQLGNQLASGGFGPALAAVRSNERQHAD
jgi:hypothetical protein